MEFAMNRPLLQRSIRSPTGGSRVGVLAATVAAAILVKSVTLTAALAQQPGPAAEPRDQAPIGHRQPRIQDLPPGVVQKENKVETGQDALDKKLENSICRGC
jgi:hypothetical protein